MRGRISCIRTGLAGAPHCPVPCLPRVSPAPERQTHPGPGFHRSPPQRRQGGNRDFVLATRWSARPRRTHPHTTALPLPDRCNARFAKGRRITCACGAVRASLHLPRTTHVLVYYLQAVDTTSNSPPLLPGRPEGVKTSQQSTRQGRHVHLRAWSELQLFKSFKASSVSVDGGDLFLLSFGHVGRELTAKDRACCSLQVDKITTIYLLLHLSQRTLKAPVPVPRTGRSRKTCLARGEKEK